jgi:4'-phosphopantetheinyl transferase
MDSHGIQLWQGDIIGDESDYPVFWKLLEPSEQQHALLISNQQYRLKYVEIHARLKMLLADVINTKPLQLRIQKAEYGKPYLVDYPELAFNLSHTANKIIVAYGFHHELGVDIETCKPRSNLAGLVDKCFAEEEQLFWRQLPESQQTQVFYRFWTRKEAFVKAVGRGIALGLSQCVINPAYHNRFLRIPSEYGHADEWRIQEIEVENSFCAAYVTKPRNPA